MFYEAVIWFAVGAHFAFLVFGVFGGFLAWRWPRILWVQIVAAAWLLVIVVFGLYCPLTWLEDRGREKLGRPALEGGFLDNHVAGVFYPHGYEWVAQIVVAVLIIVSWAGFALRRRRKVTAAA
ncbi:DUF2784 domain-containing protein [Symbioplanes lichenis]|uniref:DUF2784 domain-containing protein n=1 Tax=Symbioplanes lichenis TaxID=1629072 RepID=UPI0027398544|nr:DUF2784 domain-containing protein [Actinoplanes lichenis]